MGRDGETAERVESHWGGLSIKRTVEIVNVSGL